MLHSDVRSFVKHIMLVSIYPSFYAIKQINQKTKSDHEILYLSFYYRYELSPVNEYCSNPFQGSLISETYFKLVQTEKTLSFPLRLKTRMSCSTGATQSLLIKTSVDIDILPFDVAVSQPVAIDFFWKWL